MYHQKKGQCCFLKITTAAREQRETTVRTAPNPPDLVAVVSTDVGELETVATGIVVAATEGVVAI